MSSTTIELNGKRYDMRTGKVLSAHQTVSVGGAQVVKPVVKNSGVAVDGFSRRKAATPHPKTAAHAVHAKTTRSKTLMRSVVKKPAPVAKAKKVEPKVAKHPVPRLDIDPRRANRAQQIKKSNLVSRFGSPAGAPKAVKAATAPLPVRPEPKAPPLHLHSDHHAPKSTSAHKQSFQKAIDEAQSHKQPKAHKNSRHRRLSRKLHISPRTLNIAAGSLSAVLLIGFIAYQNVPNFSMQIAATRAGIDGRLPGYHPAGFGLSGPIKYQQGQITLEYKSRSDERQFAVQQRASQWNSETLLENYVAVGQKNYQTFQDGGKTIYIYNDNNATWVDGGVWYQIEGKSALNNDQLLRIAASM